VRGPGPFGAGPAFALNETTPAAPRPDLSDDRSGANPPLARASSPIRKRRRTALTTTAARNFKIIEARYLKEGGAVEENWTLWRCGRPTVYNVWVLPICTVSEEINAKTGGTVRWRVLRQLPARIVYLPVVTAPSERRRPTRAGGKRTLRAWRPPNPHSDGVEMIDE